MIFQKISYSELNSKQKEIYNFQKLAAVLADYGFNCIKLADDWQGADFLAYHRDGIETLKVQLKGRLTVDKKYIDKELYMAFPFKDSWCLIPHDELVLLVQSNTNWLNTSSWQERGCYHSTSLNSDLLNAIEQYLIPK